MGKRARILPPHRSPDFALFPEHERVRARVLALADAKTLPPTMLLVPAVTGGGKTEMIEWLEQSKPSRTCSTHSSFHGADDVVHDLLRSADPAVRAAEDARHARNDYSRAPLEDELPLLLDVIRARQINAVVLDDADGALRRGTATIVRGVVSILRVIQRECGVNVILFGLQDLPGLLQFKPGERVEVLRLEKIGDSPAYRGWLAQVEEIYGRGGGFTGHLADDHVARLLLNKARGFVGFVEHFARDALLAHEFHRFSRHNGGTVPADLHGRVLMPMEKFRHDLLDRLDDEWTRLT